MELILKKDNKTLEFVSGSQEVNVNDDLVQIISVMPEMPLSVNESLWVAFEQNGTVAHTLPLFGDEGRYTTDIPQAMIDLGGEWEFQILRRRYQTAEHEGAYRQTASNKGAFTIGEGVKTVDGTLITTAMLTTLYREVVEDKAIIKEQVAEATTQAETALEHAGSAEASASTAQENAAIAGSYATAAEVSAQSILPKLDAAETAAASASESAAVAMASVERAESAAVAAESAADAAVEKVSDLEKDIALLNTALMQGGIIYKADTETAYNERITAGGLNVLDGSFAKLEKVVGSTVKCNNLFDINGSGIVRNARVAIAASGVYSAQGYSVSEYTAVNGASQIVISGANTQTSTYFAFYDKSKTFVSGGYKNDGTAISVPENAYYLRFDFEDIATAVMVNAGETALPYQPYFEGLKNASFAGIESTNADGTEVSTLNFPKTELGEWDELDFEKQKVVVGTRKVVFDGTENWVSSDTLTAGKKRWALESYIETSGANNTINSISSVYKSVTSLNTYDRINGVSVNGRVVFIYDETYADKTVADFKAHLAELYASGNPVTVRYSLKTPTETPFTAEQSASGNEYEAWANGTERVLGNDNAEYGATNTLSQNYIVVKE